MVRAWMILAMVILPRLLAAAATAVTPIPFSELGARATEEYQGDAIGITATFEGAQLRTAFQKLSASATPEGLWLTSTETGGGRLRLIATTIGRRSLSTLEPQPSTPLPATGAVVVRDKVVIFTRPGLTEEYSVSVDGVRQDFVITGRPAGRGDLWVELALTGARAEPAAYGAKLILDGSRRQLAYSGLHVVDATGRELAANLEVLSADRLAVRVADAAAAYPVRIDPCCSDADWVSLNGLTGANNTVNAIVVDGAGNVYIGGSFTAVGTAAARYIARWDGSTWSSLSSGMDNAVYALAVRGTNLFAGGFFTKAGGVTVNRIAMWDINTGTWSALGLGMDNPVYALAILDTNLFVGGDFSTAINSGPAPVNVNRIARWDGTSWSALGLGMNNTVNALATNGSTLYAGGAFTTATNSGPTPVTVNRIAKWDGSTWSALGTGMLNTVRALAVNDTNLYVGGDFSGYIAKWNSTTWSALGSMNNPVYALAVNDTNLYAGGFFTTAGGSPANYLAKWSGTSWSAAGSGMNSPVYALAMSGNVVCAGGSFSTAGGVPVNRIAKWSGSAWSALGQGVINNTVYAVAVSGSDLFIGGDFTASSGVTLNHVARWNGSAWSALGTGVTGFVNSTVRALAVIDTNLYVGGYFSTAGAVPAICIAKWSIPTATWSALGSGTDYGTVLAMAARGTDLYVGGDFGTMGGVTVNRIAKWNSTNSTWSALGVGISNNLVEALAVIETNLYAGGNFTKAGGIPAANNIAKWDITTSTWSALGSGVNGNVRALAAMGTNLYAGGDFTDFLAKWNGTTWKAMGPMNNQVYALAARGIYLYAGGVFTVTGGAVTVGVAKFAGGSWTAVCSGTDGAVWALATDPDGYLCLGGVFVRAGPGLGKVSPFVAKAYVGSAVPEIIVEQPAGNVLTDGTATINFGRVPAGSTADRVFTIKNIGSADLAGVNVTIDGSNATLFAVTALPATTVSGPVGSTTFTVRYAPTSDGPNTAGIHIASNDCEQNPFDVTLTNSGPLTIQCASPFSTNTSGCATSRTLLIPANLTPPSYSGGSGPPTLSVKFEGEPVDYLVPPSLTFPIGVTNLVWTYTAGVETASCTQRVTVVMGVNQSPTILPVLPPPTVMAVNSSKQVTLLVSDAETAATLLSVSSTSGSLVTVTPPSGSPNAISNYTVTINAGTVTGAASITNIVTDACGATRSNIFTVQVSQPPTLSAIAGQTAVARSASIAALTVPFRGTGSGTITPSVSQVLPPPVMLGPGIFFQITAQSPVFLGSGSDRTVLLRYNIPTFSPIFSSALFPTDVQVTLTVSDPTGLSASRTFLVHLVDAPDLDGISDAVESQVPNLTGLGHGDGNGDGIQDSNQLEVASFPTVTALDDYVTVVAPTGTRLVNVQSLLPPPLPPPPPGASFPHGLIKYQVEGLPSVGASVDITLIFHGGGVSGTTFYKFGPKTAGAASEYYNFMLGGPDPDLPAGLGAVVVDDRTIILHLRDGFLGDFDLEGNGVIIDPGGPALVSVQSVALSISSASPTAVQISWPLSAGALVLQYTDSLAPPITWHPDTHPVVTNGLLKSVTVDLANGSRFYSLGPP